MKKKIAQAIDLGPNDFAMYAEGDATRLMSTDANKLYTIQKIQNGVLLDIKVTQTDTSSSSQKKIPISSPLKST